MPLCLQYSNPHPYSLFFRAKLYKVVHGKDLVFADMKQPSAEPENNRKSAITLQQICYNIYLSLFFRARA